MNKNRILYYIFVSVLMLITIKITDNLILSGFITIVVSTSLYMTLAFRRASKRLALLEDECDPYAFIEATEKQYEITGKNKKIEAYLSIDRAVGYILIGEYDDAVIELEHIDQRKITSRSGAKLVYYVNLAAAYFMMGKVEEGNRTYSEIIDMEPIKSKRYKQALKFSMVTKHIANKEYEEAKALIEELKDPKLSKRKKVTLAYNEGLIYLEEGSKSKAISKFREVVSQGNKLYIAKLAKGHISRLDTCID